MFAILYPNGRRGSVHDQVFKGLLGRFLPDFLTLVAPEPAGRLDLSQWTLLDKETFTDWPQGKRRELDLLAEVPLAAGDGRSALIHIEIEARFRPELGPRFADYYMQVRLRHRRPVLPIALCLRRIVAARLSDLQRFLLVNCVETYLQLKGRDAEELDALLAHGQDEEVRAMRARKMSWAEEIFTEVREEGVQKGVEKGVEIGREEGARQILLRQLRLRFGSLSDEVRQRVEEIHSVERLSQLADQILTARSLEEMGLR